MRHRNKVKQLGRKSHHRKAMLSNMARDMIIHERITTTLAKAKAFRPYFEKIITRAREKNLHNIRLVARKIRDRKLLQKLFDNIGPRYKNRPGGYLRIYKLNKYRAGDASQMAVIELVEEHFEPRKKEKDKIDTEHDDKTSEKADENTATSE